MIPKPRWAITEQMFNCPKIPMTKTTRSWVIFSYMQAFIEDYKTPQAAYTDITGTLKNKI